MQRYQSFWSACCNWLHDLCRELALWSHNGTLTSVSSIYGNMIHILSCSHSIDFNMCIYCIKFPLFFQYYDSVFYELINELSFFFWYINNLAYSTKLVLYLLINARDFWNCQGRARYLLPLFCLQVFDFCATSFSFVSYFSFEPEIRKWIAAQVG